MLHTITEYISDDLPYVCFFCLKHDDGMLLTLLDGTEQSLPCVGVM